MNLIKFASLFLLCALAAHAQLAVTVSPVKITGQRVIVPLALTNNLPQSVEAARVMCVVLNEQGKMVGQTAKWVICGFQGHSLSSRAGTTYNFVITSPQPLMTTNLSAKIVVNRVVLERDQIANPNQIVNVTSSTK